MRTNVPMFLDAPLAERPADRIDLAGKAGWAAALDAVCSAVAAEYQQGLGLDPEDDRAWEAAEKDVHAAALATWHEGISHDDWCSDTLRRLRAAACQEEAPMIASIIRVSLGTDMQGRFVATVRGRTADGREVLRDYRTDPSHDGLWVWDEARRDWRQVLGTGQFHARNLAALRQRVRSLILASG